MCHCARGLWCASLHRDYFILGGAFSDGIPRLLGRAAGTSGDSPRRATVGGVSPWPGAAVRVPPGAARAADRVRMGALVVLSSYWPRRAPSSERRERRPNFRFFTLLKLCNSEVGCCNTVHIRKTVRFWHKVTFLTPIHEIGYPNKGSNEGQLFEVISRT